jgi:glycerophosphoryl diester phosphodiesterase
MQLAALRVVDLGGGARIPTLDEVLEAIGPHLLVNVELKAPERHGIGWLGAFVDEGLPLATADILRRHAVGSRALVSSFDPLLLGRFRRAAPTVTTGLLFDAGSSRPLREAWAAPLVAPSAMHPDARLVEARTVARWHRAGRAVNAWTVDDPREIACLAALGVDGIITNRPTEARRAIG